MPSSHLNHQVRWWGGVQNGQNLSVIQGKYFLWTMTSTSLTQNEEHSIPSHILKTIFGLHASVIYQTQICITGDPLHSRAACTQPCKVNTHSRAYCSPGARLCEQWGHGCVNNGARLCASARLCRGSPVCMVSSTFVGSCDPSGQLAELIVYITSTRVDLYSYQILLTK